MWLIGKQIEDDSSRSVLCMPTFWTKVLRTGSPTREQPKALSACQLAPSRRDCWWWHTVSIHTGHQCKSINTARFPASANMHLFNLQDPMMLSYFDVGKLQRHPLQHMQRHDPPAALRYLSLKFKLRMMWQTSTSNLWWLFVWSYIAASNSNFLITNGNLPHGLMALSGSASKQRAQQLPMSQAVGCPKHSWIKAAISPWLTMLAVSPGCQRPPMATSKWIRPFSNNFLVTPSDLVVCQLCALTCKGWQKSISQSHR